MQNSKRVQKILKKLDKLREALEFYTNNQSPFKDDIKKIQELIVELSLDKKEDHIRLAKKLKHVWEIDNKNKES